MMDGTWEVVEVDASHQGDYLVAIGWWNPRKDSIPIGIAWSLIEEAVR